MSKRKAPNELSRTDKKARVETKTATEQVINCGSWALYKHILKFLNGYELLQMVRVDKHHEYFLTSFKCDDLWEDYYNRLANCLERVDNRISNNNGIPRRLRHLWSRTIFRTDHPVSMTYYAMIRQMTRHESVFPESPKTYITISLRERFANIPLRCVQYKCNAKHERVSQRCTHVYVCNQVLDALARDGTVQLLDVDLPWP
jgi:hypothetical protein